MKKVEKIINSFLIVVLIGLILNLVYSSLIFYFNINTNYQNVYALNDSKFVFTTPLIITGFFQLIGAFVRLFKGIQRKKIITYFTLVIIYFLIMYFLVGGENKLEIFYNYSLFSCIIAFYYYLEIVLELDLVKEIKSWKN